ncbi:MAG: hypothetical protein LQ338_007932 [Usnochroma carphineum]|nr:MAG: hypothetical protein LQ338_007932 [Usnochroma carphineum]
MVNKRDARTKQVNPNLNAAQKQRKEDDVVHNTMTASPTEDWVLYPDDVVIVKHSTVREKRAQKPRRAQTEMCAGKAVRPTMLPTPPGSSPAQTECQRRVGKKFVYSTQDLQGVHDRLTSGPTNPPAVGDWRMRTQPSRPYKLPTPDISDVDEDEFWACCHDGSRKF